MNLYEILQNSGRVGEGMTHFERLFAQKIGGGKISEISGVPPLRYIGDGRPLTDYLISGNAVQDGTPSPDAPVDAVGSGIRTGNTMPAGEKKTVEVNGVTFSSDGNGRYRISGTASGYSAAQFYLASGFTIPTSASNGGQGTLSFFNSQANNGVTFIFYNGSTKVDDWIMTPKNRMSTAYNTIGGKYVNRINIIVISGTTVNMTIEPEFTDDGVPPSEFEPYGYKLPLTVNGTEYPIYLGTVPTTRRIKKLVLTGEETTWYYYENATGTTKFFYLVVLRTVGINLNSLLNTHGFSMQEVTQQSGGILIRIFAVSDDIETIEEWKSYLAAQYANGTPVTVWYVLAEPETSIVNEPLMKIGDYADTISAAQAGVTIPTVSGANVLDVPTTVPPSEVWIRGRIKEV